MDKGGMCEKLLSVLPVNITCKIFVEFVVLVMYNDFIKYERNKVYD
jgi:hypothetical protein